MKCVSGFYFLFITKSSCEDQFCDPLKNFEYRFVGVRITYWVPLFKSSWPSFFQNRSLQYSPLKQTQVRDVTPRRQFVVLESRVTLPLSSIGIGRSCFSKSPRDYWKNQAAGAEVENVIATTQFSQKRESKQVFPAVTSPPSVQLCRRR